MIIATHGIVASQLAGFDADAQAFFDRVTTAGGSLSATEKTAVNQLVLDLKGYSIWSKMKAIYPFVGGTATSQKYNLKNPQDTNNAFRLVFNGGWTHSSTGLKGNGTNTFANTFFLPNNLSQNDNAIGFYSRTNIIAQETEMGIAAGEAAVINMGANFLGAGAFARNFNSSYGGFTNTDTRGFYTNCRIISTENKMYKNGSILGTVSAISSTPNSTINISISGEMQSGNSSVVFPSSKEFAFAFMSSGLNDIDNLNLYTAVQAFQTTLSRQV